MRNDRFGRARSAGVGVVGGRTSGAGGWSLGRWVVGLVMVMAVGLLAPGAARGSTVVAYPLASCFVEGTSWHITANGTALHVRAYYKNDDSTVTYYYCHCGMSGSVTYVVDATQTINTYSISPAGYNIAATKSGTTLTFTLGQSRYLAININSKATLYLLADPIESNPPPSSGTGIYNMVTDYGADNSGATSVTSKVASAIADANADGGGTVYFPAGVYLCGKVTLKSHVHLYFAPGAVLYADPSYGWAKGLNGKVASNHFISATGLTDVEVYGRGTIDCRGSKLNGYKSPQVSGGTQINPISTDSTNGIQIYGVIVTDSTAFTIQPGNKSQNVTIANVKVLNRQDWQWNDGIDFTDSYTGTVTHCFVCTCDDGCCVKSGYFSQTGPSHDITYDDIVVDSGVGCGFSVGSETNYDIYNVTASNFQVMHCHRGFSVIHWGGLGNWHDIHFTNWRVEHIGDDSGGNATPGSKGTYYLCPLRMEIYDDGHGAGPVSYVDVTNFTCDVAGAYKSYLWGQDSTNNISHVTFTNLWINGTKVTALNSTYLISKGYVDGSTVTFP